jgi:hypothetical protein
MTDPVVTLDQAIEIQAAFIVQTLYTSMPRDNMSDEQRDALTKAVMQILRETVEFAQHDKEPLP